MVAIGARAWHNQRQRHAARCQGSSVEERSLRVSCYQYLLPSLILTLCSIIQYEGVIISHNLNTNLIIELNTKSNTANNP